MSAVTHCPHCLRGYTGEACPRCDPAGACEHVAGVAEAQIVGPHAGQHRRTCLGCGRSTAWVKYGQPLPKEYT